ncbi:RNA polymerase sigma factor [Streptomyces goshikiensis]|uniref:RNA polymerase sigma factor n=1 Tax=Streptomyces goshikiensis TaxID=1942 RepID=UPI003647CDFF
MTEKEASTAGSDPRSRLATLRASLIAAARAQTHDVHLSEDVVQIAMLRVYLKFPDIYQMDFKRLVAYSRRVVRNAIVDEYKSSSHRLVIPHEHGDIPSGDSDIGIPGADPGDVLARVKKLISGLPPPQREAVSRLALDGATVEEVATKMLITEETVKKYFKIALKKIEKISSESSAEVSA